MAELKKSMDPKQIALLATTNQAVYMKARLEGTFFENESDPSKGSGPSKEPQIALAAKGTYPIEYLLLFMKMAKQSKATHVKFELARENHPMRMEFESDDMMNVVNGRFMREKTWIWIAPRIDSDDEPEMKPEDIKSRIAGYENDIANLKRMLPAEEAKPL